ncbi:MAG: hypothetical protein ACLQDM_26485 [Bradyrhizobium sp.]
MAVHFEHQPFGPIPFDDQGGVDGRQRFAVETNVNDGASNRYDCSDQRRMIHGWPIELVIYETSIHVPYAELLTRIKARDLARIDWSRCRFPTNLSVGLIEFNHLERERGAILRKI